MSVNSLLPAIFLSLLLSVTASAQTTWDSLSSGEHSFKTLGEKFYIDVPVREIKDA